MVNRDLIEKKLKEIDGYIQELRGVVKFGEKEILSDYIKLRALERIFQLIVDEMIHLNLHRLY